MAYRVEILADSISPVGARLTTFQLMYPRMVHAEFMTHRALSRNASSSRAIPFARMLEWVEREPALPIYWGSNKPGMQAGAELAPDEIAAAEQCWLDARNGAAVRARELHALGLHKQVVNRILEPWGHINVVGSATVGGWMNYFALRCHRDAMPEMRRLAVRMADAYRRSVPSRVEVGGWHLPYVRAEERASLPGDLLAKVSVARCARVSYLTHEGRPTTVEEDVALHDRLLASGHWSPFEHQARAAFDPRERSGNFRGWLQYRQSLPVSVHCAFTFDRLDAEFAADLEARP